MILTKSGNERTYPIAACFVAMMMLATSSTLHAAVVGSPYHSQVLALNPLPYWEIED